MEQQQNTVITQRINFLLFSEKQIARKMPGFFLKFYPLFLNYINLKTISS
jgi:hypothetical protein